MRRTVRSLLPVLLLLAGACDDYRGPRLALPTNSAGDTPRPGHAGTGRHKGPTVYGGKTAEQWGQVILTKTDHDEVAEACRSLRVLAREGRPYLVQGLDSTNPETRRLCLESLTVHDFKKLGESGRQKLVTLSGDHDDVRIRERAAAYLKEWHGAVPSS